MGKWMMGRDGCGGWGMRVWCWRLCGGGCLEDHDGMKLLLSWDDISYDGTLRLNSGYRNRLQNE